MRTEIDILPCGMGIALTLALSFTGCGGGGVEATDQLGSQAAVTSSADLYQGCYTDQSTRALPTELMASGATVETCIAAAKVKGLAYAGLQYRGQCFGGNTLEYTKVADTECNLPCSADASETCGGSWRNSIYRVATSNATNYAGCYTDSSTRALPVTLLGSNATVETCIAAAKAANLAYAGVQYGGECYGGNTLGYTLVADSDCNMPCKANSGEVCGGRWRNSIYSTSGGPVAVCGDGTCNGTETCLTCPGDCGQCPPNGMGTGTNYEPSYIKDVAGGGSSMPSWTSNVVTASCAGDGSTDDTSCLQNAANAARDQKKSLVIPYTNSYYKISASLQIYTSVAGVGGMPTIHTTAGEGSGTILTLAPGMTGWVYNLHLRGTFDAGTSSASTEWDPCISVGSVNGVTIAGNLLENPRGDCISGDMTRFDAGNHQSVNVIVDGNTMRNPWRCGVALTWTHDRWIISNNIIEKNVNYVTGIDFEPEVGGKVTNIEVLYNKFVMNNKVPKNGGSDGLAWCNWTLANPSGGNLYLQHNYGSFGTGWPTTSCGGYWSNVQANLSNVAGDSIPTP